MNNNSRLAVFALAGAALSGAAAHGRFQSPPRSEDRSTAPSTDVVQCELERLRAEIVAYRESLDGPGAWLTEQRAAEVRGLVEEVLADADSRSSLQASGMTAGWDKGFFLSSPDGNFKLKLSGYVQVRWNYSHVDEPLPGQRTSASGFENRRTYLTFEGHIVNPSWTYRVQGNFRSSGGELVLQDAYLKKSFDGGFYVQAGQAKSPYMRETLASDTGLLLVDRSIVESAFGAGRTQGVFVGWSSDVFRIVGTYCDGSQAAGGLNSPWQQATTDYAFIGRAEAKFGKAEWSQFSEMTSFPGEEFNAIVGAAVLWQRGDAGSRFEGVKTLGWTVDGELDFGGANLFGAFVGRHSDANSPDAFDGDQYGAYGQGGFFVQPQIELFARYEWGDSDGGGEDLSVVTAGANWYLAKQQLKLSADIGYGINAVVPFFGVSSVPVGWRTDGDSGQVVVRVQFQLVF